MGIAYQLPDTTSRELALAIQQEMVNEEHPQPPTLGSLLASMRQGLYEELVVNQRIDAELEQSIIDELATLVESYGDEALAEDFVEYSATDTLASAMTVMLNNLDPDQPPTLVTLRSAILNGLATRLVASGEVDLDDEPSLLAEVEDLIKLHGEDTPAELFLR